VEHFNLLSRHLSGGAEKTTKIWVKVPGILVYIWTRYVPSKNQNYYSLSQRTRFRFSKYWLVSIILTLAYCIQLHLQLCTLI